MNSDFAPDDLAARISAITVHTPDDDHLDIERAIRSGKKRRHQRLATVGAFGCVALAVTASAFLLAPAGRHDSARVTPASSVFRAAVPADQLAGVWLAGTIDGNDVSAWRDPLGQPARIVIGADRAPNQWQVYQDCGPSVKGNFDWRPDGSFIQTSPPDDRFQSCPAMWGRTVPPDVTGLIRRTAFVTVDPVNTPRTRTMKFLDRGRKLIALFRENTAFKYPTAVCERNLGKGAAADGLLTFEWIRDQHLSATAKTPDDDAPRDVAIDCQQASLEYAVTVDGEKEQLR